MLLEKTVESPMESKEIKTVNPKGNQPWISLEELWPPDAKSQLFGKDLEARREGRQKAKGAPEDEMVGCRCGRMQVVDNRHAQFSSRKLSLSAFIWHLS